MSTWYEAKEYDIDYKREEVDFFVNADDYGRVYLSVSFKQLKEIATKINVIIKDDKP